MNEWHRFALMRAERDEALKRVRELEDELLWLQADYNSLEQDNLDLVSELAEARNRHPSARKTGSG